MPFVIALLVGCLLAPSAARAQERDGAAWVSLAREAIAAARYDTARIDLDRAQDTSPSPALAREIAALREELDRARARRAEATRPRGGWTHGVAMGLLGGSAFAAASGLAFGALAAYSGFGRPPCGSDCTAGVYPDVFFGLSVASTVSMLAQQPFITRPAPGLKGLPTGIEIHGLVVDDVAYTIDDTTHEIVVSTPAERHPYCVMGGALRCAFEGAVMLPADYHYEIGAFDLQMR